MLTTGEHLQLQPAGLPHSTLLYYAPNTNILVHPQVLHSLCNPVHHSNFQNKHPNILQMGNFRQC